MGKVIQLLAGRAKSGKRLPKPVECFECGDPIETARLQLIPGARYCVSCEKAREARRKRIMAVARPQDTIILKG